MKSGVFLTTAPAHRITTWHDRYTISYGVVTWDYGGTTSLLCSPSPFLHFETLPMDNLRYKNHPWETWCLCVHAYQKLSSAQYSLEI